MSQMVVRFDSNNRDAELCIKKGNEIFFKNISVKALVSTLVNNGYTENTSERITILDKQIIAANFRYVVIRQPEHKKIVTLFDKSYMINFPNAIYIVHHHDSKIKKITAFSYKEYEGLETNLYEYPMPNELTENTICMGSAKKEIFNNDYVAALNRVIATPYSHTNFSGIKGFTNSQKWFEYLQKNEFPYKLMRSLNKKLKDIRV